VVPCGLAPSLSGVACPLASCGSAASAWPTARRRVRRARSVPSPCPS